MPRIMLLIATLFFTVSVFAEKPQLPAQNLSGEEINLGDRVGNGKWLLVMYWATDCPICKGQEPTISAFHEAHSDLDAEVVGISIDGPEKMELVKQYLEENKLSYPNYVGDLVTTAFSYTAITQAQFLGTPTYLLFNPEGKLLGDNPGPMRLEALESFIEKNS